MHKLRYINTVPKETRETIKGTIRLFCFCTQTRKTFDAPSLEICYVKVVLLRLLSHLLHLPRLATVVVEVPRGHLEARQLRHSLQNHPQRLLVKVHRLLAEKKIGRRQVREANLDKCR